MINETKKYWVWLSLIKGLGAVNKRKLLKIYKSPEEIYELNKQELLKIDGIGENIAESIVNSKDEKNIRYHLEYMEKNNIDIINIYNEEYPDNLKEIYDAPISLYVLGNKNILKNKNIAIVGCRECSEYGKKVAKYFAYNLTKHSINIVSGLAKGVDTYAHIGSLSYIKEDFEVGKTIAVVGNGVDVVYPKENQIVYNKIIQYGGAIISEYPCGTKPNRMNFPARNRIVSGMSSGIIVIEAKEKSGTLITVDFALEQGRDVFVVPGNIDSINSVGTNELIKQGARIITNYREILQ